jgi:uncharacterized membrane protein YjjP (DUF1212 family)|tara:strand:+ start:245 stop:397 length:153 start_codon:yes stop_codon:yes gene_type:complete
MKKALRIFAALSIGIASYVICGLLPFGEWVDILGTVISLTIYFWVIDPFD